MLDTTSFNWIAILLGCAVICLFSFWDFHLPFHPDKLRYAVSRRRYVLAISVYMLAHLVVFLLLLGMLESVIIWTDENILKRLFGQNRLYGIHQIGLMAATLAVPLSSYLPGTRGLMTRFRHFVHLIALFPQSIQLMMVLMAGVQFKPSEQIGEKIQRELERYSVPPGLFRSVISASAIRFVEEACTLRDCFGALSGKKYSGFLNARAGTLKELDLQQQRVLRRIAAALLSIDLVDKNQLRIISQFVAEDCQAIILQYRTLIAEASMSCVAVSSAREDFLISFGYHISLPPMIPFFPLVVAFGLDFGALLWPLILSPWISFGPLPVSRRNILLLNLAHAISLTAALAWAIAPKAFYEFARPLRRTLPFRSYWIFGGLAYVTGVFVMAGLRLIIRPIPGYPLADHPTFFILTNSCSFFVIAVCMSVLVDFRLRERAYEYNKGRLKDAVIFGVAGIAAVIIAQLMLMPFFVPPLHLLAMYYASIFAVLFVLGFFVPSVATAHLQVDEVVAKQMLSTSDLVAQVKQRKARPMLSDATADSRV